MESRDYGIAVGIRAPRGMGWDAKSHPMGQIIEISPMGWD
ncbi:unnamed protein product, partial [Rotaria magnacalcarata]